MDKTEQMNRKLYEKLSAEYDDFYEKLKALPPEKIIESSYEKVFKEDILMCIECGDMDYDKAKALYAMEKPLSSLYDEWLSTDCSYMDMLRDVIDTRANLEIRDLKQNTKTQER